MRNKNKKKRVEEKNRRRKKNGGKVRENELVPTFNEFENEETSFAERKTRTDQRTTRRSSKQIGHRLSVQ